MKQLNLWRNVLNLFLRYAMICVFMFMCVVVISSNAALLGPLFGVFYFVALIYYFWFTMRTEGELDVNRVKIGQMPRFRFKGAVCALILAVPLMIINVVPNFFPNPVPEEYQAYFTGEATYLSETDSFNQSLREVSGKDGYISEITFDKNQQILHITYETSDGNRVLCDGTTQDQNKIYAFTSDDLKNEAGEPIKVYYTADAELTDEQKNAFEECKNAVDDIAAVMGSYPHWQQIWSVVKAALVVALQYFCSIFAGNSALWSSVVYCLCMLVLCVAAQVGYEMGYRNIVLLRKNKKQPDPKAGDSIVIQRGRRSSEDGE
ncbi:MAG: hypothetical protein J6B86_02995 [Clostridia bacterium]|nr:hypothetical protein [Clostridia bacterium]